MLLVFCENVDERAEVETWSLAAKGGGMTIA
jgi:hypothetical protein